MRNFKQLAAAVGVAGGMVVVAACGGAGAADDGKSLTIVEWGEGLVEQLVDAYLEVRIDRRDDESRVVDLVPHGGDWAARLSTIDTGLMIGTTSRN